MAEFKKLQAITVTKFKSNEGARQAMDIYIQTHADGMPHDDFAIPFCRAVRTTSVSLETDTTPARATFAFEIPPSYGNVPGLKSVHGGAIAMFLDNCTSIIMMLAKRPFPFGSLTRNLNITYMRPAQLGERVVVEAEAIQVAKSIATIQGVLKRESDGVVVARCQHDIMRIGDDGRRSSRL